MLAELTLQDFEPVVGSLFECRLPDGGDQLIACQLREATPLGEPGVGAGSRRPFSNLFFAAGRSDLVQQICSLTHPRFPDLLEVFLVPVGRADGGLLLEGIFV